MLLAMHASLGAWQTVKLIQNNSIMTIPTDFAERVRLNQQKLTDGLKPHYDFIVCGSGSSGSGVARRLAENPDVSESLLGQAAV
jgi:hypothetical protein